MNIPIRWKRDDGFLTAWGRLIPCSCDVRNLENGRRLRDQIVYTIPHGRPYSPQIFPPGLWQIGYPRPRTDCYRKPVFIPTNAARMTKVWETAGGEYIRETDEWTLDEDYGLHASCSPTTLGCIRVDKESDILWIAGKVRQEYEKDILYIEII